MAALKTAVEQITAAVKKYEEDLRQHKSIHDLEPNQDFGIVHYKIYR